MRYTEYAAKCIGDFGVMGSYAVYTENRGPNENGR